jgi:hypothetical protein
MALAHLSYLDSQTPQLIHRILSSLFNNSQRKSLFDNINFNFQHLVHTAYFSFNAFNVLELRQLESTEWSLPPAVANVARSPLIWDCRSDESLLSPD